jgi:hypothetical protein
MNVVRFLILVALFLLDTAVFAQKVLVERAPEYFLGEDSTITFTTNRLLGPTVIKISTEGSSERDKIRQTHFSLKVKKARFFSAEGSVFMERGLGVIQLTLNGVEYRAESTVEFPLHEGDTFENTISKSRPCQDGGLEMCVESITKEKCSEVHAVPEGVSFICRSDTKLVRYVMDHAFKWVVTFKKLDSG